MFYLSFLVEVGASSVSAVHRRWFGACSLLEPAARFSQGFDRVQRSVQRSVQGSGTSY